MKTDPSPGLTCKFLSAFALLATLATSPALTVETGPGAGPGTVTGIVYDDTYPKWLVADLTDPVNPDYINVISSDSAGSWTLNLSFAPGTPDLVTGAVFDIEQLLTLDPASQPLSGWQQQLLSPDWSWEAVTVFDYDSALPLAGLSTTGEGTALLTSLFDPVSSPVNLSVVGTLKYNGAGGPAVGPSLAIAPVPEPGVIVMGLGASTLVLLRRRGVTARVRISIQS